MDKLKGKRTYAVVIFALVYAVAKMLMVAYIPPEHREVAISTPQLESDQWLMQLQTT